MTEANAVAPANAPAPGATPVPRATLAPGAALAPADESVRVDECAQEQIHVPGAIQPHGALLSVDLRTFAILQASMNSAELLGVTPRSLVHSPLSDLFGGPDEARLRAALGAAAGGGSHPVSVQIEGRRFDAIVHRVDRVGIIEFEPITRVSNGADYLSGLYAAIHRLSKATDVAVLRKMAARELRRLTGFDQVMVYHFHADDHGEVMADDHRAGMTSYLGLHFPASDIPSQARVLYLLKGSGLIANSDYQPVALLPINNPQTGAPLNLSHAELRSVSPFHLQFMRNMGQGASFTLSLALDGRLLGMMTCAHPHPRRIPFLLRRACEILAQQVTLQLDAMTRTQQLTRKLQAQDVRKLLMDQLKIEADGLTGLTGPDVTILDLVKADGATVSLHQRLTSIGHTPSYLQTTALFAALTGEQSSVSPLLSEALAADRPDLAELVPSVAGVFVLPFGGPGDCLAWFRREVAHTVDWLGEQSPNNRSGLLAPRNSFEMWRQTVTGRSAAWDEAQVAEAAELGRDIDQVLLRRAEAKLVHMGLHDALTGLPNRNLLMDRITSSIARADRDGGQVVVLFCDLDNFKTVNDTAGHAAGDAVLVEAAARLTAVLRTGDSIARVGGDEFVIVLEPARPAPEQWSDPREVAAQIAGRIRSELSRPITYQGQEHVISVSVGMTFATAGTRADELLRDADAAMYRAKQDGRNRVAVFDDSLRADLVARARAEHALRSALAGGEPDRPHLGVAFQPVIDLDSGRLVSFEVLARLTDSDGQSIAPDVFIPVAEQTGMIDALGEAVLDAGLAGLVRWRAEHVADIPATIAVNFSARQAQQADLPTLVRAALRRHDLTPSDLTLELTESVLMKAGSATLSQLTELHDAGVGITIDDFGTGYASLRYLAILPVDAVKIDRSFTAGLPSDATSAMIVRAVAGLAADMGLSCVVEGIETEQQLAALPAGVLGQGYLLGRPALRPLDDWPRPIRAV